MGSSCFGKHLPTQAFEFAFSDPTAEAHEAMQPAALVKISNLWFNDF